MVVHIMKAWTSLLLKHYNTHVYIHVCIYKYGGFLIIMEVSYNGGTHHPNLDQLTIETT